MVEVGSRMGALESGSEFNSTDTGATAISRLELPYTFQLKASYWLRGVGLGGGFGEGFGMIRES